MSRKKWLEGKRNLWSGAKYFLFDLRKIFFPADFHERYSYLGCVPIESDGKIFSAILPIILTMDYYAKPRWCPRVFLRFLHIFGNGSSVYHIRNKKLHNLHSTITKGILLIEYKTKFSDFDLRIYLNGPIQIADLSRAIEHDFFTRGRKEFLIEKLIGMDPELPLAYKSLPELENLYCKKMNQ